MNEKLVTIAKYDSYIEADMIRQMLDDFGIKSVVFGSNTANVYSMPGIAAAQLQVFEGQADEALKILETEKNEGDAGE